MGRPLRFTEKLQKGNEEERETGWVPVSVGAGGQVLAFHGKAASREAREGRQTKSAVALSGCVHDCRFVPCQPCVACRAKCTCATTPAPPRPAHLSP